MWRVFSVVSVFRLTFRLTCCCQFAAGFERDGFFGPFSSLELSLSSSQDYLVSSCFVDRWLLVSHICFPKFVFLVLLALLL